MCVRASLKDLKKFCGTHLYKRRVPAGFTFPRQNATECHADYFLWNLSLEETSSVRGYFPHQFQNSVFFAKLFLKSAYRAFFPLISYSVNSSNMNWVSISFVLNSIPSNFFYCNLSSSLSFYPMEIFKKKNCNFCSLSLIVQWRSVEK